MRISYLCEPAPIAGRANEDACFIWGDAYTLVIAAIDGATQRIDVPALYRSGSQADRQPGETGARFAARTAAEALHRHVHREPREMVLAANALLRQRLEQAAPLTPGALARLAPQYAAALRDEPRLVRLMLPVCVATVVKLDLVTRRASFAHVGDTALFLFQCNGTVSQPTEDQMGQHDDAAIGLARALQAELQAPHLADVLEDERVTSKNRSNGIYHNYVDAAGQPDAMLGVGVINGLPEIEHYLQTGEIDLETLTGLLVCSDGFPLPAPWQETVEGLAQRLGTMRDLLLNEGIQNYYRYLRDLELTDAHRDRYPRFKVHDDATGILLEF